MGKHFFLRLSIYIIFLLFVFPRPPVRYSVTIGDTAREKKPTRGTTNRRRRSRRRRSRRRDLRTARFRLRPGKTATRSSGRSRRNTRPLESRPECGATRRGDAWQPSGPGSRTSPRQGRPLRRQGRPLRRQGRQPRPAAGGRTVVEGRRLRRRPLRMFEAGRTRRRPKFRRVTVVTGRGRSWRAREGRGIAAPRRPPKTTMCPRLTIAKI